MKILRFLKNLLMVFWFGWFALAGIAVTYLLVWLLPDMPQTDILLKGSVVGIITGGVAALMLFIIGYRKYGNDFLRRFDRRRFFNELH